MSSEAVARGLILVVEDESVIAEIIRMHLARAGYGVHIERDGRSALTAVRSLRPAAIVLDIGLPELDGIEVCRRLRAEHDWTPVLFVTARDDDGVLTIRVVCPDGSRMTARAERSTRFGIAPSQ